MKQAKPKTKHPAGPRKASTRAKPTQATRAKAAAKVRKAASTKTKPNQTGKAEVQAGGSVRRAKKREVVLLSGGNPQIAKGDGAAPVKAYIAAMPDWKRDVGKRLDALIVKNVPNVLKAVKWNSPFYGIEGKGWFLSFHVLTRYVKVTFFAGKSLRPLPPGGTPKSQEARWIDLYEGDPPDDAQMLKWVKQAAKLPGWVP
jgi:hypothetical protein